MSDVYVRISRPHDYEDVHPDLVIADAIPETAFEIADATSEIAALLAALPGETPAPQPTPEPVSPAYTLPPSVEAAAEALVAAVRGYFGRHSVEFDTAGTSRKLSLALDRMTAALSSARGVKGGGE